VDVRAFFTTYCTAFIRRDAPAIARHFADQVHVASETGKSVVVQVATGVGLAMTYVPAPNSAYDSLQFISHQATLGSVVRGIHYFGAGAMVVLVLVHMTQVFLFGSYKFPREANWMSGSLLLIATFLMAFTGQLLRWDQDAFW